MNKQDLINRLRQLLLNDKNAYSIYADILKSTSDKDLSDSLSMLLNDEARHISSVSGIISELGNY